MPLPPSLPVCIAIADDAARHGAVEALTAQGYRNVLADSFPRLIERARNGICLAVVDPRLPGLGAPPMQRLRATSALHRCPIMLADADACAALRQDGAAAPDLIRFMVEVHKQVSGRSLIDHLYHLGEMLQASPDFQATMEAVLASLALAVPFDTGTLFLLDGSDRLEPRAARGYDLGRSDRRTFAIGEGVVGWAVKNRAPTIVGDSDIDSRFQGSAFRSSRSLLAVPLIASGRALGALSLVRRAPAQPFGDDDLVLVATIGDYAGLALDNVQRAERESVLQRRLGELDHRTAEQRAAVAELERNNRQYASVVSTVSHELRSPLFGIQGFAQLMMEGHSGPDDVRDFATEIHDNAVRLSQYVERILSEDGLQRGQVALEPCEVSLRPLVEGVLRSAAASARESHRLINEVTDDLPPIWGDPDKVVQILQNLVGNAVKYSPAGGRVAVSARTGGGMVEVVVEDQGIGVPPAERSRVFERFTRVISPQTRAIGGAGIGLAIVKGLVELHGGRVWVDDAPGRGSRFHVELPLAPSNQPVGAPLPEAVA
jgi:signal transduction histidine kinase